MQANGNNFYDPVQVDFCKIRARDVFSAQLYNVLSCITLSFRSAEGAQAPATAPNISPNPFQQQVTIRMDSDFEAGTLTLFNTGGQLVFSRELVATQPVREIAVDLTGVLPGMYCYQLMLADGRFWTGKLVAQ